MTRDDLEAMIWRTIASTNTTSADKVDAILKAADQYMVAEGGLTAERRTVLEQATSPRRRR